MANYIVTKNIPVSGTFKTLATLFPTLLDPQYYNPIKKVTFTVEAGMVLSAKSMPQNTSCFASEGDSIKLVNNSGGLNPVDITIYGNEQYGDGLDLRTAMAFTVAGANSVNVIIYI